MKLPDDIPTLQAENLKLRTKTWNQRREIKRLNAKLAAFAGQLREPFNDPKLRSERMATLKHDGDKARKRAQQAETSLHFLEGKNNYLRELLKDDAAFKLMVELRQAQKRIAELEKQTLPAPDEVGFWQAHVASCELMLACAGNEIERMCAEGSLAHARENLQRALAERGDSPVQVGSGG